MNKNSMNCMKHICLLCRTELLDREVEAGYAVCSSCRGYYFPERRIYYRLDNQTGPDVVITCQQQLPKRLARMADIDTWISRC